MYNRNLSSGQFGPDLELEEARIEGHSAGFDDVYRFGGDIHYRKVSEAGERRGHDSLETHSPEEAEYYDAKDTLAREVDMRSYRGAAVAEPASVGYARGRFKNAKKNWSPPMPRRRDVESEVGGWDESLEPKRAAPYDRGQPQQYTQARRGY